MTRFPRNITVFIILLISSNFSAFSQSTTTYNIKNYGAKGNGKNLDTKAIDKAIDAASAAGGGMVFFPAGDYLSVTIHLKSNVGLYLDHGATIIAATTAEGIQYDLPEKSENSIYQDYGHSYFHNSLIVGENLHDISITGPGHILGTGLLRAV
ncbi:MAG: glycoside hydrolase family 28 protein, partial [Sphingobacteriaceae bacterium]